MLTTQERNSVELAFSRGPAALLEQGWTYEQIFDFFERPDVRLVMEDLTKEFRNRDAHAARLKFGVRRVLGRLGSGAAAVLGASLAGPVYARDKEGNILKDAKGNPVLRQMGPTRTQLRAATEILDRIGVSPEARDSGRMDRGRTEVNLNLLLKRDEGLRIEIEDDPAHTTKEQKALSRERVRTLIDILGPKLPKLLEQAQKTLGPAVRKKVKGVRKVSK